MNLRIFILIFGLKKQLLKIELIDWMAQDH